MRPLRSLLIYCLTVFVGGALLAPWLYLLVQRLARIFPGLESVAESPFHHYVNRGLLAAAIIGLWPLLHGFGIQHLEDVGLPMARNHWRLLVGGFIIGFSSLALLAGLAIGSGARSINPDHTGISVVRNLAGAGVVAVVVAVLEEILFRGAIFGGLRRAHGVVIALLLSSMIYAIVHFFNKPESPATVDWMSGFALLPRMMRGFGDVSLLVPGFLNLTLAGVILGLGFWWTGNLYFSIGLHAGWIFWLKSYGFFTRGRAGSADWLWGTSKLIDGWVATIVLVCVLLVTVRLRGCRAKTG